MNKQTTNGPGPTTIYIVGPTASGKTALSIDLALAIDAEIICADSQTIRREMNIGTAKPSIEEMKGIPHHMLDQIDPYDEYSLAVYQKTAKSAIDDISRRGKIVIIVGGTGLYIDSLYFNYKLPKLQNPQTSRTPPKSPKESTLEPVIEPVIEPILEPIEPSATSIARSHLATRCDLAMLSVEELQNLIIEQSLELPRNIQNPRHLANVLLRNGNVGSHDQPAHGSIIVGVNPGREVLINRINNRVDKMFEGGFVDEVRGIVTRHGRPPRSFDAIGYRIVMRMLDGEISEQIAKELFKIADRQYAKRQLSWFKRNENVIWFESPELAKNYILSL
jgi:tRNA dimethylallyltransferase